MRIATVVLALVAGAAAVRLFFVYRSRNAPEPARVERVAGIPKELDTLDLKILNFYAPEQPVRGEPFLVCYGVLNAKSVRMEPSVGELAPVISRCVNVTLQQGRELALVATGRDGQEVRAAFRVGVVEPRPEFEFVSVSGREIRRGEKFTLCYGVKKATRVWVEPEGPALAAGRGQCAMWYPARAPRRLIAESGGGRDEVGLPVRMLP